MDKRQHAAWRQVVIGLTGLLVSRGITTRLRLGMCRLISSVGLSLALLVVIFTGTLAQFAAAGLGLTPVASAHAQTQLPGGTPNRSDPSANTTSIIHTDPAASSNPTQVPPKSVAPIARGGTFPMQPGVLPLHAGKSAHFIGSDGVLSVDVPAGAITSADETTAGGSLSLEISQVAFPSGSSAGGSGRISYGMYLLQLVDAQGVLVTHGLRQPVTLHLNYGPRGGGGGDLAQAYVALNTTLPRGSLVAPTTTAQAGAPVSDPLGRHSPPGVTVGAILTPSIAATSVAPSTLGMGAVGLAHPTQDPAHHTLSASVNMTGATATASFNTNSAVASFGKPDPFNADLSAGSLSGSYPIDVPSGPGGLTPPINLAYSADSVSENHSIQAGAPWVGEGWNLDLGEVSWSEHNVAVNCSPTCSATWENSWQLSDPYGTGAELIPPNIDYSTYWDDTTSYPCNTGTTGHPPTHGCPVQWHTATESHAKIWMYENPNPNAASWLPDSAGATPPCWRVFLTNGIMEEFGCTQDSIEYYFSSGNGDYISSWKLDLIVDAQGNQIHITYQQDKQKDSSGHYYIRDAVPQYIQWDSPTCLNNSRNTSQLYCTSGGTAPNQWAPLLQVNFSASHSIAHPYGGSCGPAGTLRCDDPQDYSGGLPAPKVQSDFVLNDVYVQVCTSGCTGSSPTWNTLTDYRLGFDQSYMGTTTDPVTGQSEHVAGRLLLTSLQKIGDDGTTSLPPTIFGYQQVALFYEDSSPVSPAPTNSLCGPSWNAPCNLWGENNQGNSWFLSSDYNGLGSLTTYTWQQARDNTHGGYNGANSDPLSCDGHETTAPCYVADDNAWSHAALTQSQRTVLRACTTCGSGTPVTDTTKYQYFLTTYAKGSELCPDCTSSMYWGNQNDLDWADYYNSHYMGFTEADVSASDGSITKHYYYATDGWGVWDNSKVSCNIPNPRFSGEPCKSAPWWGFGTAEHGREYQVDSYDTDGTHLLKRTKTSYLLTCPPTGVPPTPPSSTWGDWDGHLVSSLDRNNPVAVCDIQTGHVDEYTFNRASSTATVPDKTTTYTYDNYGRTTSTTVNSNGAGANTGSPTVIVTHNDFVWNDNITAFPHSATGEYLVDFPADTLIEDSGNTTHYSCSFTGYDGQPYATGQQSTLTLGEVTTADQYTSCGTSSNSFATSGLLRTTHTYDSYGNQITTDDPDANAGDSTHLGCTVGSTTYSSCTTYDSTFEALKTSSTNALNQKELTSYATTPAASNGFGLWAISTTDKNGQVTTYAYDGLDRMTSRTMPGDTTPTTTWAYADFCPTYAFGTAPRAQTPCLEIDQTQELSSSNAITSRGFYDGYENLVETREPGPPGYDVVSFTKFDPLGHDIFDSIKYTVTAYTGQPGSGAFSSPDYTNAGTSTTYDGLDRTLTSADALSHVTTTSYQEECGGAGDTACYAYTAVVDPLSHQTSTYTDALGREIHSRTWTGNSTSTYAVYTTSSYGYDANGHLVTIYDPNTTSISTTYTYDAAGRKIGEVDPDIGTQSYTYDANGNRITAVDARGASGTIWAGYDGIDRQIWRNTTNSATGAYAQYYYDTNYDPPHCLEACQIPPTYNGHLTKETFTGGPNNTLSGSYVFDYDARGNQTKQIVTVGSSSYTVQTTYDDASNVVSQTYPDGEVVTNGYSANGWLEQVQTQQSGATTTLLSNVSYSGVGGANHLITGGTLGGTTGIYAYAATYDDLLRLTNMKYSRQSDGATMLQETRSFDGAGNLNQLDTTLPEGVDDQTFCYDEQNRVTWAGTGGVPPCQGTPLEPPPNQISGAAYINSFGYDVYGRLTNSGLGAYTYGDSSHLHAATAAGSNGSGGPYYTAGYDAAGDMTCRAASPSTTCSGGTTTGAALTYDNEQRLTAWQNAPSSPNSTDAYLYDGDGDRVAQQVTTGLPGSPNTTTTVYVGNIEEIASTGSSTTTTTYYYAGQLRIAMAVNGPASGTVSYLCTDALGSTTVALSGSGTGGVTADQLYGPYGGGRYQSGTMPTDYGYTGQHSDSATGLDYYNARYYDPELAQFISADTTIPGNGYDVWGLSHYAYVEGNPLIRTDPTGHDGLFGGLVQAVSSAVSTVASTVVSVAQAAAPVVAGVVDAATGISSMVNDVKTIFSGNTSLLDKVFAGADLLINVAMDVSMVVGVGEGLKAAYVGMKVAGHLVEDVAVHAGEDAVEHTVEHEVEDQAEHAATDAAEGAADTAEAACSFAAGTLVAAPTGEHAIASLHTGQTVIAYNPATAKSAPQTIQAVYIHHDTNLLDVTLRVPAPAQNGDPEASIQKQREAAVAAHGVHAPPASNAQTQTHDETVHTTSNHPWLTADAGWMPAGFLRLGEQVLRADGSTAVVVAVHSVPGGADMWDLTIANVHTFAVGEGRFVVHNCGGAQERAAELGEKVTPKPFMKSWATVAVGDVQEADGTISRVVSISQKASTTLQKTLRASLEAGEIFLEHGSGDAIGDHAEDYILRYAEGDGRRLVDIGASNGICEECMPKILRAWPGIFG